MAFIEAKNLSKTYASAEHDIEANKALSFSIEAGELVVITGASGAGKTTLLNLIGGMDVPTDGELTIDGEKVSDFDSKQRTDYRRQSIGFIFQSYNLMPKLNATENVELASDLVDNPLPTDDVLERVGLAKRAKNYPRQLSGGEQQRVAIARAISKRPKLLLADEPTGALDDETGKTVLRLLQELSQSEDMTVILVTHNQALTPIADRVIILDDGELASSEMNDSPADIDDIHW
ncbi:MAG: ABC transporter ATP-binding protein [Aerococcus sp.]|nr:ABC transporter ATP-binding protein [Aerococcus sp.]